MKFIITKFGITGLAVAKAAYIGSLVTTGIYTSNPTLIAINVVMWAVVFNNYRYIRR